MWEAVKQLYTYHANHSTFPPSNRLNKDTGQGTAIANTRLSRIV
jgi:hypothetical protein